VFGSDSDDGGELMMNDVVVGGPGLVAVGTDLESFDVAVWTSVDGIAWSRLPFDEDVFGGDGAQAAWSVVAGGPGLVAVGSDGSATLGEQSGWQSESFGTSVAAVWTSKDGMTWERVPNDDSVFGSDSGLRIGMNSVVVGGPGLVAVGGPSWDSGGPPSHDPVGGVFVEAEASVWTSVDGITWSRLAGYEGLFGGTTGAKGMWDVAAGGPGLVAIGAEDVRIGINGAVWSAVLNN
jgi:hypothetical protein